MVAFFIVASSATGLVACSATSHPKSSVPSSSVPSSSVPAPSVSSPPTTPSSSVPPPASSLPIRAAFYYPWFPEAWAQQGQSPFTNYSPTRGFYRTDVATARAQITDMQYGGIRVGIASWFGRTTTTDNHWPSLIAAARGTGFTWAPYYEAEGISDPTPSQISADLDYLHTRYGADGGLTTLNGRGMPVFVYNADDLTQAKGCATVRRWIKARDLLKAEHGLTIYVDLKVFPRYKRCPGSKAIDGWHQYEPASANQDFSAAPGDGSYSISPGYWKSGAAYGNAPFLARDRARWSASIESMRASGAKWQLITTYNEWGEGTAIESASACRTPTPADTYCDWRGNGTSEFLAALHAAPG